MTKFFSFLVSHNAETTCILPQEVLTRNERQMEAVLWTQVQLDARSVLLFPFFISVRLLFSCLRAHTQTNTQSLFPFPQPPSSRSLSRTRVPDVKCARLQDAEQMNRTEQGTLEKMEQRGRNLRTHTQHPENIAMKQRALIDAAQLFVQQQERRLDQEAALAVRSKCTYNGVSCVCVCERVCVRTVCGRLTCSTSQSILLPRVFSRSCALVFVSVSRDGSCARVLSISVTRW